MLKRRWIDTHIHVSDYGPNGVERGDILDDLLDVLDRSGADLRFVLSPDGHWMGRMAREGSAILEANRFIYNLVRRAPDRLYGSCEVNPNFLDESLEAMQICFAEWGFVQFGEMLQYMMKFDMDSDAVEKLSKLALKLDVPIQVHISTAERMADSSSWGMEQLEDLFGAVERVPDAKYILAHAVGMENDNPPVVDKYLDAIEKRYGSFPGNFWVEIRDFDSPGVQSVVDRVPVERIIAGTDWTTRVGPPFLPYGAIFGKSIEALAYTPGVNSMVSFLKAAGASDEDVEKIGFRNAAELSKIV